VTPHFDGARFRNTLPHDRDLRALLREGFRRAKWPARHSAPWSPAPPPGVTGDAMRVTWVSHATALVQVAGFNFLTDPVWSEASGPGGRLGPRRLRNAGIRLEDLPRIHAVLLSHNHYDHLDLPTRRRIDARDRPRIYTGLGNAAFLSGFDVVELDWWQAADLAPGIRVEAAEARHFSGRGLFDRDRTLWAGFRVDTPAGAFHFAGDSGYGPHYAEALRRQGPCRLALLPIGAYLPRAFMRPVHMDPDEAVRAHLDLGAAYSLGIHWGTFQLTSEAWDDPPRRLALARESAGVPEQRFRVLAPGEAWEVETDATLGRG
jgi:L-ascorbate metabolism protein UlaG (beta-lactamase superfamily)